MNHGVDELGPPLAKLRELCAAAGRTTPVQVTLHGNVARPDDVERYAEAGVTRLIVTPWSRTSEAIDGLARFADRFISTR